MRDKPSRMDQVRMDRLGRANADANNSPGRAWTVLEPATARTIAEQAPGTGVD